MIMNRTHAITAGIAAAAALTATGITYATAAPAPQTAPAIIQQAPAQAPMGGEGNNNNTNNNSKGNEGNNNEHEEHGEHNNKRHHEEGWIHINERSYSAHPNGCITVVSGLGSTSFNIRNDSKKTVEFFRGVTCDNGAPIAIVGPRSTSDGVRTCRDEHFKKHDHFKKDEDFNNEDFNNDDDDNCRSIVHVVRVKNGVIGSFRIVERHGYKGDRDDEGGDY
jgi:hypothetical protein